MSVWFEDNTFWECLESFLFSQFRSSEMTGREAEQILTRLHPRPGAAVLDLCYGPGRHSLEFAHRGFRGTGVDLDTWPRAEGLHLRYPALLGSRAADAALGGGLLGGAVLRQPGRYPVR